MFIPQWLQLPPTQAHRPHKAFEQPSAWSPSHLQWSIPVNLGYLSLWIQSQQFPRETATHHNLSYSPGIPMVVAQKAPTGDSPENSLSGPVRLPIHRRSRSISIASFIWVLLGSLINTACGRWRDESANSPKWLLCAWRQLDLQSVEHRNYSADKTT